MTLAAEAIIAALSVQYFIGGKITGTGLLAIFSLNPLFALTPPATMISFTLRSTAALMAFVLNTSTATSWNVQAKSFFLTSSPRCSNL